MHKIFKVPPKEKGKIDSKLAKKLSLTLSSLNCPPSVTKTQLIGTESPHCSLTYVTTPAKPAAILVVSFPSTNVT